MVLWQTIKTWFPSAKVDLESLVLFDQSNQVSYRFARRKDIRQLLEVERDVYEEIPWTYRHFYREIVENRQAAFIVAEKEEKIIGYIGMRWTEKPSVFNVSNFIIRQAYQSQGFGEQLLAYSQALAKSLRIEQLILKVDRTNFKAQAFYRKRGFDSLRILENYYDNGNDALEMGKELVIENS